MQHDHMADSAVRPNDHRKARVGVQHATVLDVRSVPDLDRLVIAANDGIEPDAHILADVNIADHGGVLGHPVPPFPRRSDANVIQPEQSHGPSPLHSSSSRSTSRMTTWS